MKYTLIFIVMLSLFLSCKKDPSTKPPSEPSERYKVLTSHYWRHTGYWYDTTDVGKVHPELVPKDSSINMLTFSDSCKYYTCIEYNPDDGYIYTIKGWWCGYPCTNTKVCKVKDIATWKLKNQDQVIDFYGDRTIISLNDTILKFYDYSWYNNTKKLVRVHEYKPYVFK